MRNKLRSAITTEGRKMAGARSLWRANGMKEEHFGKPLIAIANSFTQFVPGHVHLHDVGQLVKKEIEKRGCFAAEFNTIAIDDGIAMGHGGMLYSLPSRDIIADSVEYMCNAHMADALVCISNCDKITPGMMMAAMRLNIPVVFVSGGPMEAGVIGGKMYDLVDAMVMAADDKINENTLRSVEMHACPTCGSCSGMFTANSMNCLAEALGLALPGNGTIVATHINRKLLFEQTAAQIVRLTDEYYRLGNDMTLPRNIATKAAFGNAMRLDIAMGGSTNTVLHILAIAHEAGVDFTMADINELSKTTPNLCKVAPNGHFHVQDVNRAGGILGIMAELDRGGLLDTSVGRVDGLSLGQAVNKYDIMGYDEHTLESAGSQKEHDGGNGASGSLSVAAVKKSSDTRQAAIGIYASAPGGVRSSTMGSQDARYDELDRDRQKGCIRSIEHAYHQDGGLAVLYGNIATNGCIVKTAGVDPSLYRFTGKARVYESQEEASRGILNGEVEPGSIVIIRYEGPKGGPGMQEMLYPTSYLKSMKLDKVCALLTDGRFSGGTSGLSIGHVSPEAASKGTIALIKNGDTITIDIPARKIEALIDSRELKDRKEEEEARGDNAWKPANRQRTVTKALKAYAMLVSSADKGAIRLID